ncbi:MAG: hypothetical protein WAX80_01125 [Minisyncoccia bacterium]
MRNQPTTYNLQPTNWFLVLWLVVSSWLLVSVAHAQSVDLLWQGDSYTPPFYQGRTLWSKQSRIILIAIPQGLGNPANLYYKWIRTGTVLGNTNGVGKNSISFSDSILSRPQTIKVEILSINEDVLASASVRINPTSPTMMVYEDNPLYGYMFHRETVGTHQMQDKEATFTAFPLFFSIFDRTDNTLEYQWRTNAGGVETGNSVTYRAPDDATGSSEVKVSLSNTDKITQSANKSFLIEFGD